MYVHTCNNTMAPTKKQNSRRYYRRKVERALHYLQLARDFENLSITQSAAASTPMTMTKAKAKNFERCFGKVSNSTDLEGDILMLLSSLYLFNLIYTHPSLTLQVMEVIQIPRCVSYIYDTIGRSNQITSGFHSLCYGEITPASLQSLWHELVRLSLVTSGISSLLELGSGVGKPSFHFSSFFRCLTVGIKVDYSLYFASLGNLKKVYSKAEELGLTSPSVAFIHKDIFEMSSFDPFEIIYTFDKLFEPELLMHIAKVFNDSRKCKVFISYQRPSVLEKAGFINLSLQSQLQMKMAGSGEMKTCYLFSRRRKADPGSDSSPDPIVREVLMKHWNGTLIEANKALDVHSLGSRRNTRSSGMF